MAKANLFSVPLVTLDSELFGAPLIKQLVFQPVSPLALVENYLRRVEGFVGEGRSIRGLVLTFSPLARYLSPLLF